MPFPRSFIKPKKQLLSQPRRQAKEWRTWPHEYRADALWVTGLPPWKSDSLVEPFNQRHSLQMEGSSKSDFPLTFSYVFRWKVGSQVDLKLNLPIVHEASRGLWTLLVWDRPFFGRRMFSLNLKHYVAKHLYFIKQFLKKKKFLFLIFLIDFVIDGVYCHIIVSWVLCGLLKPFYSFVTLVHLL